VVRLAATSPPLSTAHTGNWGRTASASKSACGANVVWAMFSFTTPLTYYKRRVGDVSRTLPYFLHPSRRQVAYPVRCNLCLHTNSHTFYFFSLTLFSSPLQA